MTVSDATLASELPLEPARHAPGSPTHGALTSTQWGVLSFLLSEVAFFSTLIVTYMAYMGRDIAGPTPSILSLPLVIGTTLCLLASSGTVHLADQSLRAGAVSKFLLLWAATIALGVIFLCGTAYEWHELIYHRGLTISTNLFGTTFYTLVGFHALHVTGGVIAMSIVLVLALRRHVTPAHAVGAEMVSWYWHFVDVVWIIVFCVVYLAGR
jgi:cytochrome c oxidase subunit III